MIFFCQCINRYLISFFVNFSLRPEIMVPGQATSCDVNRIHKISASKFTMTVMLYIFGSFQQFRYETMHCFQHQVFKNRTKMLLDDTKWIYFLRTSTITCRESASTLCLFRSVYSRTVMDSSNMAICLILFLNKLILNNISQFRCSKCFIIGV